MDYLHVLKDLAAAAFRSKQYQDALELYSQALQQSVQQEAAVGGDAAVLSSNVAAVLLKLGRPDEALEYATTATQMCPSWPKGFYRQASALQALQQHSAAQRALQTALDLTQQGTPEADELVGKLAAVAAAAGVQRQHEAAQQALVSGHAAWAKNRAREAHTRSELTQQLQQGMAGYAWEPEDWEWRATWTPSMRAAAADAGTPEAAPAEAVLTSDATPAQGKQLPAAVVASAGAAALPVDRAAAGTRLLSTVQVPPGSTQQQQEQTHQVLAQLTLSLAELEAPQRGLRLLQDTSLLGWYQHSIKAAVASAVAAATTAGATTAGAAAGDSSKGPLVLVLANGGGGLLGLVAAAAGAGRVVVVEKSRWGCRASRQLLEANSKVHGQLVGRIELVPGPLTSCYYAADVDKASPAAATGAAADESEGVSATDSDASADLVLHIVGQGGAAAAGAAAGVSEGAGQFRLRRQADVVVTDLFDYSVLGQGVLGAVQAAAAAGLLAPGVVLVPEQVAVKGQLVNTQLTQRVSGFELSPVNRYKWHPTIEHIEHDRYPQLQPASSHITLQQLSPAAWSSTDTQGASGASAAEAAAAAAAGPSRSVSTAATTLHPGCSADALLVWVELRAGGATISTGPVQQLPEAAAEAAESPPPAAARGDSAHPTSSSADGTPVQLFHSTGMGMGLFYLDQPMPEQPQAGQATSAVAVTTTHSPAAVRLVFDVSHTQHDMAASAAAHPITRHGQGAEGPGAAHSKTASAHSSNSNSTSGRQAAGSVLASVQPSPSWSPHGFPRHAWLPRWHFDMLADGARNDAYEAALRRAIAKIKGPASTAAAGTGHQRVHVLDLGAGTGLLSMLAVRCGADAATAVESSRHMADTANSVLALNSMPHIAVVHKDARFLTADDAADQAADLLVFEVFDCGCIGEGALHIVAAARKHLKPGARILPASAQVFCQPIQYGAHIQQRASLAFDTTPLAPYAWQPDYFEAQLHPPAPSTTAAAAATDTTLNPTMSGLNWKPLAAPQPVFAFDFNSDPLTAFAPAEQHLSFTVSSPGVCNAVAFWFELRLDEHTTLSSSPYAQHTGPSTTWKQAIQLLPEQRVQPGQVASLTASHDTYAISFRLSQERGQTPPPPAAHSAVVAEVPAADLPAPPATAAGTQQSLQQEPEPVGGVSAPQPTGVPLFDPLWRAAYEQLSALQGQLVKAIAQDPLEHRTVAAAALQLAMRPWQQAAGRGEHGSGQHAAQEGGGGGGGAQMVADPHHAAALLTRLMA